ncbi:hypothetical protein TNCV_225731 [Trichonephila clavipes]|nr:hypothetical protein TNCV_225731 [Trichonephila clavipes]
MSPIPRYLERADADARFLLITGHDFFGVYLHWLSLAVNEACSLCGYARMDAVTSWSNALNSMNTRLTTSSVGTGRLGVKWSRSQARELDK